MKALLFVTVLSLVCFSSVTYCHQVTREQRLKEFASTQWYGGSYHAPNGMPLNQTIYYINQVSSNMVRITANWRWTRHAYTMDEIQQLQSQIAAGTLSLNIVRQTAQQWLDPNSAFQKSLNWNALDAVIEATLLTYTKLSAVMVIGDATAAALPLLQIPGKPDTVIDPNIIGAELYLILLYQFNRAQVNRYKHLQQIKLWQIENESNDAFVLSLLGVRYNSMSETDILKLVECALIQKGCEYGGLWNNFTYVTDVMRSLYMSVKDEDPETLTTTNVLVDTPKLIYYDVLRNPEFYYMNAIASWDQFLDVWGFDCYANHIQAQPVMAQKVGDVVRNLKTITSKPIIVLETGYSVAKNASAMPQFFNFTEQNQALYLKEAFNSVQEAGGNGFIIFGIWRQEGITPPPGGFTEQDLYILSVLQTFIAEPTLASITKILLHFVTHPSEAISFFQRAPVLVEQIENGWGIVDSSGNLRPAFHVVQQMYQNCLSDV